MTFYIKGDELDEFYILRLFWQMPDGDAYCCAVRFLNHGGHYAIKERKYYIIPFNGKVPNGFHSGFFEQMNNDGTFPTDAVERLEAACIHVPSIPGKTLDYLFEVKAEMDFERLEKLES